MKPSAKIETESLIKMIQAENRAEYSRYRFETDSPLSSICDSGDALGPLIIKEKIGRTRLILSGQSFYSRFRPGDRVELRVQKMNSDFSAQLSDGWRVEVVRYPSPGKIEVVISGSKPIDEDSVKEIFLFQSSSSLFSNILMKKITELPQSDAPIILGTEDYKLSANNPKFRKLYEELNDTQKSAVQYLIGNNLSGAIQGPPGTGKTQLLQAVISLALHSGMKVCVASFTNAAVDNLLGRVVGNEFEHNWKRVGDADKVRTDLYPKDSVGNGFVSPSFEDKVNGVDEIDESNLFGATLHKLAFNTRTAPKFDLLVIDEAGQVPVFFWPFIQRMTKRLVLVGDQFQLPPVLAAQHADLPFDNIFSVFLNEETPMMETQYRMRREIQAWSSEKFYRGKLIPHLSVTNRDYFSHSPAFVTDGFVVPKKFTSDSSSKCSTKEADFIADKIERLLKSRESLNSVGVICPYRAQAGVVNASLQNKLGVEAASRVLVDTVERFQGQEREAIFLSFGSSGNSQEDLRFLSNPRRLNVAVTRAKSRFFCLFDEKLIERSRGVQSEDLNEFLRWVTDGRIAIKKAA